LPKKARKKQNTAKKCQMTSKTPNSPKFGLEKRHLATLADFAAVHREDKDNTLIRRLVSSV
jgi:hypothetical protein